MKKTFKDICKLAEKLRSGTGCPWDRAQTIETMLNCMKSETSEVEEAVLKKDYGNLQEELGDVLFQIVIMKILTRKNQSVILMILFLIINRLILIMNLKEIFLISIIIQ